MSSSAHTPPPMRRHCTPLTPLTPSTSSSPLSTSQSAPARRTPAYAVPGSPSLLPHSLPSIPGSLSLGRLDELQLRTSPIRGMVVPEAWELPLPRSMAGSSRGRTSSGGSGSTGTGRSASLEQLGSIDWLEQRSILPRGVGEPDISVLKGTGHGALRRWGMVHKDNRRGRSGAREPVPELVPLIRREIIAHIIAANKRRASVTPDAAGEGEDEEEDGYTGGDKDEGDSDSSDGYIAPLVPQQLKTWMIAEEDTWSLPNQTLSNSVELCRAGVDELDDILTSEEWARACGHIWGVERTCTAGDRTRGMFWVG